MFYMDYKVSEDVSVFFFFFVMYVFVVLYLL